MPEPAAGLPAWVLLDTMARVGRRANATTALAVTSAGSAIEVSFEIADPPVLSRCFVHSPDLTPDDLPIVTGADGAFLLINVVFPDRGRGWASTDVFVYRAGPGAPSLGLLPLPYPVDLHAHHVGVLSRGEHCLVVVPERQVLGGGRMGFDLHVFSTKTVSWSTKAARLARGLEWYAGNFYHSKAFSIGGSSLAWVDRRHGILLCDELGQDDHDHPEMRLIQLPQLMPTNKVLFGPCYDDTVKPPLDPVRDVTCRDGWFRLVEMEFPDAESSNSYRWTATMFKTRISSDNWELCRTIDSADLSPAFSCCYFPDEIWDCEEKKLALDKVLSQDPTLDMYRDDVVYMIAKLEVQDPDGWVLAVDTENQKLENVAPFSAERFHFSRTYIQCAFSASISNNHDGYSPTSSFSDASP